MTAEELIHAPESHKLGKARAKRDDRNLKLARYLSPKLPAPPPYVLPPGVPEWPMFGNNEWGDCVFAGAGHEQQVVTFDAGKMVTPTLADVLGAYSAVTGFKPSDPSTDRGTVVLDALNWRRKVGLGGHKIAAFAEVDTKRDSWEVKKAVELFKIVGLGLALPISAQRQKVWTVHRGPDGEPGSWGGHYVPIVGYDPMYLTIVTWGQLKRMSWSFFHHYCDEAYAILSPDLLAGGRSPEGFDLSTLNHDLSALAAA